MKTEHRHSGFVQQTGAIEEVPVKHNLRSPNDSLRTICTNIFKPSDETTKETQRSLQKISRETYGKQAYILEIILHLQEQYSIEDPGNLVALL